MNYTAMNYLPHIRAFWENEHRDIELFAKKLEWRAQELFSFKITLKEFDDGEYLVEPPEGSEEYSDSYRLAVHSLNYIKTKIIELCTAPPLI